MISLKTIGGILLVVGTSIGGGMLALPVATAKLGFVGATFYLFVAWMLMTFSAFLVLEVNLWLPRGSNLVSMSKATLGVGGEIVAWVFYLVLLYCLLSAYTSGGSDVLHHLMWTLGINTSQRIDCIIFAVFIASIVYQGIGAVDHLNRYLMMTKLISYFLLVLVVVRFIDPSRFYAWHIGFPVATIMIMLTSYGFATIVPSLREYFDDDVKKLRKVILIGSLIPLACYTTWVWVIHGVLPLHGENSLLDLLTHDNTTSSLVDHLNVHLGSPWVTALANVFTSFSVATSFLGTSLGLTDFLADGLKLKKRGKTKLLIFLLAFGPPLLLAMFLPNVFIKGLDYAGTCCAILLMFLPIAMACSGRYYKKIAHGYQVMGGKLAIYLFMTVSIVLIMASIYDKLH